VDEKEARAAVLEWCREVTGCGMWGGVQGQSPCRVVGVVMSEPTPDRPYLWRDIVYAEGETWQECAVKLGLVNGGDKK
jgi:hypothetical protein